MPDLSDDQIAAKVELIEKRNRAFWNSEDDCTDFLGEALDDALRIIRQLQREKQELEVKLNGLPIADPEFEDASDENLCLCGAVFPSIYEWKRHQASCPAT